MLCVLGVSGMHISSNAVAAELTAEQQALLQQMDVETAAQAVNVAEQARGWRDAIAKAVEEGKAVGHDFSNAGGDPEKVAAATVKVAQALDTALKSFPQLRKIVEYDSRVTPVVDELRKKGITREQYFVVAKKLREQIESALALVDSLKDPAQYLQGFAEGKLREWMQDPVSVDGDGSLQVRILPPPKGTPLFSPDAKIDVEIEYMPQDLVVTATGLYFRYEAGQPFPKIMVDNLRMETDYKKTVLAKVRALGEELTDELDLPIKVTLKSKPDFMAGGGGIRFDVTIGVMGDETVKVEAQDLVLYPGNRVDWKDGKLKVEVPLEPPVPIGTTPFGFWSLRGSFGPQDKSLGFGTKISTLATPPTTVALSVDAETQIPIKSIGIRGSLEVATVPLMTTEGKIDFSKGTIDGSFKGNDTPLKAVFFAEGKFHLQREKFVAEGKMELFGQAFANMHCEIDLKTGETLLLANGGFDLFGVDAAATLEGRIHAGFKRVELSCQLSVEVSGIEPYGTLPVSVTVSMDSDEEMPILVEARTFVPDLDVTMRVPTLADCTIDNLQKWIGDNGVKAYHRMLKALAQGDEDTRRFGAKMDKQTRAFVHQHFGFKWETGSPELDALGGQLSQGVKDIGGAWHDLTQGVGGAAGKANQSIQDVAKDPSKLSPTKWKF